MSFPIQCNNPNCRTVNAPGSQFCQGCGQPLTATGAPPPLPTAVPPPAAYAGTGGPGARPGGLTALAVINFVFAALGCCTSGGSAVLSSPLMDQPPFKEAMEKQDPEGMAAFREMAANPWFPAYIGAEILVAILLVISGIGYLKMKKVMGRTVGTVYALLAIAVGVIGFTMLTGGNMSGLALALVIELLYPLLTLFFVNVTFKHDLVH